MITTSMSPFNGALTKAVDITASELLDKLLEIVNKTAYQNGTTFESSGQFGISWDKDPTKAMGGYVMARIFHDPSQMEYVPEAFLHGNIYEALWNPESLADILNFGTNNSAFGFSPVQATGFWDEFQEYVDANFDNIFIRACREAGLSLSHGATSYAFG